MRYPIILLDADRTLFDFDKAEACALSETLARCGAPGEAAMARYREINHAYWARLERGEIEKSVMLVRRFEDFFGGYGLAPDCAAVNAEYLATLGTFAFLIPGALELCRNLHEKGHRLCIVTNGTAAANQTRLRDSGLEPYFDGVFISEVVGAEKPSPRFFDAVFAALGHPAKDDCIIVGDSLMSDIRGGRQAGIATCWFNPEGKRPNEDCDYVIGALGELESIVRHGQGPPLRQSF